MARYVERNNRYYEKEIDALKFILRSCADGRRNSQFWAGTEKMRRTNLATEGFRLTPSLSPRLQWTNLAVFVKLSSIKPSKTSMKTFEVRLSLFLNSCTLSVCS